MDWPEILKQFGSLGVAGIAAAVVVKFLLEYIDKKELEHKQERKEEREWRREDQGQFLSSLAARDAQFSDLKKEVQLILKFLDDQDKRMASVHQQALKELTDYYKVAATEESKRRS